MNLRRASIYLFILALLALAVGGNLWHHHSGTDDPDCAVCHFIAARTDAARPAVPIVGEAHCVASVVRLVPSCVPQKTTFHSPLGRAPPTAS